MTIKDKNLVGKDDDMGSYRINVDKLFKEKGADGNFSGWIDLKVSN